MGLIGDPTNKSWFWWIKVTPRAPNPLEPSTLEVQPLLSLWLVGDVSLTRAYRGAMCFCRHLSKQTQT